MSPLNIPQALTSARSLEQKRLPLPTPFNP
jgi:hypothetical protein